MARMLIVSVIVGALAAILNYTDIARGWVFFIGYFSALGFSANELRLATAKRQGGAE